MANFLINRLIHMIFFLKRYRKNNRLLDKNIFNAKITIKNISNVKKKNEKLI